jgi:hypothetical protein
MLPHIMNLSLRSLEEAVAIRRQIEQLESRLRALFRIAPSSSSDTSTARRTMSAAARARIAAAQRARWVKQKASSAATAETSEQKPRRKGELTAAGRKKLSDLMKARWAARKKTGVPNKPRRVRK